MNRILEEVHYEDIEKVLKEYTDGEVNRDLSLESQGIEAIDLLGIFHELGVSAQKYVQGERLSEKGEKLLEYLTAEGVFTKPRKAERMSIHDFLGWIFPEDLVAVVEYDQSLKPNDL